MTGTTRRRGIAFLFLIAITASAFAQKMYITDFSGSVALIRANGMKEKLAIWTSVTSGDVLTTGTGGKISLVIPGTLTLSIPEKSIVGYFFEGPGTDPRPFISVIAGSADATYASSTATIPAIRTEALTEDPDAMTTLKTVSNFLDALYAKLDELELEYRSATSSLEKAANEYRNMLKSADSRTLQPFRSETLYPAQDTRTTIIHEIQYRTILARTIRQQIVAPLYMAMKTANPDPEKRRAETADFFTLQDALVTRYDDQLFRSDGCSLVAHQE